MFRVIYFVLLLLETALSYPDVEKTIILTPLGKIQGSILASRQGKQIFSFRGIRYAKAPINELRFQAPVPVEKWNGIYNATEDAPLCPQPTTDRTSEDCLFLNVYTNKLPNDKDKLKRPVMVYFHPGGFYSGGGASYLEGPQYLLDHDIVLVTLNYRLGTLGFLSTGDKEAPGNFGLKDQVQALKWTKRNIEAYGGNRNSVTIFGYGTGGASVTLHLVSSLCQGLFHKAIAMSGSYLGQWPIAYNQLDLAKKQAKILNCPDDTSENIVRCLKTKSAKELGDSLLIFKEFGDDPVIIWSPVIEEDFGQQRFLKGLPIQLLNNGQFERVPVMLGVTADEFAPKAFKILGNDTLKKEMNENFLKIAPISFIYERDTEDSKTVSRRLKTFYLNDEAVDESLPGLTRLYSDSITGFGVNRAAKLLAEKNHQPVYYYKFNYKRLYSHFYLPNKSDPILFGVVHYDDLMYLFYMQKHFRLFGDTDPETQTVNKLTLLWTNFAKTGNPIPTITGSLDNVNWEPFTAEAQKYLEIGNELVLNENLYEERYGEWEKLFPLHQDSWN